MARRVCNPVLIVLAGALFAQPGATYRDPQGRFTVETPAGWKATAVNSDAVQFSGPPAGYATLMVLPGDDPRSAMDAIGWQTSAQWRNFAEARRGQVRFAERTGEYVTYSGTNPQGVDSYLELMGVADRGHVYLLMMSASKAEFARAKAGFDQIERSVAIRAGAVESAPPAPAGAKEGQVRLSPVSPTYYRMKKASVIDERGFERPMPALTLLIPTEWQFQGETRYQATFGGCHENTVRVSFRAWSPDQRL